MRLNPFLILSLTILISYKVITIEQELEHRIAIVQEEKLAKN